MPPLVRFFSAGATIMALLIAFLWWAPVLLGALVTILRALT